MLVEELRRVSNIRATSLPKVFETYARQLYSRIALDALTAADQTDARSMSFQTGADVYLWHLNADGYAAVYTRTKTLLTGDGLSVNLTISKTDPKIAKFDISWELPLPTAVDWENREKREGIS